MAGIFQSFRTSAMPKRLLRYAMARFDIFEDDALDLENLDLGFGLRNTLEFKDVGLKVDKLTNQLALPAEYRIKKAAVSRLQITVPLDLYSSSIELTAVGVHITLEISSVSAQKQPRQKEHGKQKQKDAYDDPDSVPTAADLAQSFLATQPTQEKRALEEALAAERQDLAASAVSSEDGSEDDVPVGTGQGLSLPAFMTDFLQGVVDRTRISIRDVAFYLDVETSADTKSMDTEMVSFRLSLSELHVEGLTQQSRDDNSSQIVPKEGKRHILLKDIRASLISHADGLSSLTRSPTTMSSSLQSPAATKECESRPHTPEAGSDPPRSMPFDEHDSRTSSPLGLQDSEEALQIPYELDENASAAFASDGDQEPASSPSTPRASIYHESSGGSTDLAALTTRERENLPWPTRPADSQLDYRDCASERSLSHSSAGDSSGGHGSDDLSHSHYFSHEEAESMYMSAFSESESQRLRSDTMPGSWDSRPGSPENMADARLKEQSNKDVSGVEYPLCGSQPAKQDGDTLLASTSSTKALHQIPLDGHDVSQRKEPPVTPTRLTPKPSTEKLGQRIDIQNSERTTVKDILTMDSISIYVPTQHQHIQLSSEIESRLGESTLHTVPGAFSVHSSLPKTLQQPPTQRSPATKIADENATEVHFAPIWVRFDISIGFLLASVARRLIDAAKSSNKAPEKDDRHAHAAGAVTPELKVAVSQITVELMDKVTAIADAMAREPDHYIHSSPEPLLRAEFGDVQATLANRPSLKETCVTVGTFRFGFSDSDILKFDRDAQLYYSVRDQFPQVGTDISVKITTGQEGSRGEINTLPLSIHADLQRLDEALNWFGGLSSFLQMGASMTSSGAPKRPEAKSTKARGVRFEIPQQVNDQDAAPEIKWDVRFGGLNFDLVGKSCSIVLQSSAVKVSNRGTAFRAHISRIQASGPYNKGFPKSAPVNVAIKGTTLEFAMSPGDEDLDRLLRLILPSKDQYDEGDDEIMVDTLLRQRRKGSVMRISLDDVQVHASELHRLEVVSTLGDEITRLAAVTKYLPEDDRPGLLALGIAYNVQTSVDVGGRFGVVNACLKELELAQITMPSLAAFGVGSIAIDRNSIEELVGSSSNPTVGPATPSPVLMVRMIGDEMEPVIRVRMRNLNLEYRVPAIMDILGLSSETTPQEFDAMLAASVANLGEKAHHALVRSEQPAPPHSPVSPRSEHKKPTVVNIAFRDCLLGLNPLGLTSKLSILLIESNVEISLSASDDVDVTANMKKAAILLIDDASLLNAPQQAGLSSRYRGPDVQRQTDMLAILCSKGYVNICQISSARAIIHVETDGEGEKHVDVELRDDLLVLETCADSTHTLIVLAGALKPPTPPSKEIKFKTEVIPMQDMLASISADAFGRAEGDYNFDDDFANAQDLGEDDSSEGELVDVTPLDVKSECGLKSPEVSENLFDATSSSILKHPAGQASTASGPEFGIHSELEVHENFFAADPSSRGTGVRWNSAKNKYDEVQETKTRKSPLKARVRDVHIIWNLFDGYDWQHTRDSITKTVEEVEHQAFERHNRSGRRSFEDPDFDDESLVGDCLFNSIYVSIPANHDPRELVGGINQQLDDAESIAATTLTTTTTRGAPGQFRSRAKKLRLGRSRRHKITFELAGVNVDLVQYPPGSETDTSIDVRVHNLEVFDHVPTSTWKKFATYNLDAGERELDTNMVHLELLLVRPIPDLAAVEHVLKVTVLPLRLHVDQDALDFITRFFSFKDETQGPVHSSPSDEAFIQRAEVMDIPVVLDFKPKRVDYAGLRGGRSSEFMNFVILEGARLTLKHIILYGVPGWERLGNTLNDTWTPNVKEEQLAGVLAGVAPVRPLVNVGSGFRELIEIPIKEYRKDGRIVRSIGKGAAAFAKTTGTEIVKLGAKMAVGTQYVLQGAEGILTANLGEGSDAGGMREHQSIQTGWDDDDDAEPEERKQISLYADQPTGVVQGLRHAYSSLARDLNVARDAIIAVPGEVMESQNAHGAARAVMRRAPTIIFRPAIGATRAVGQALMGATNAMDPENLRRVDDKYKPGFAR
ncbi:hypothetical protein BD289DRAFT_483069 [Coniella lustricola]|uniref:Autophagy-related protein 2 n=1 Tax=Coniella lustricola TaxID=2025994 RepID=A0A2T3A6U0_9PEZI|nr:hypothetical protein BD289DRAFT_483069 [Coniella lustricola]